LQEGILQLLDQKALTLDALVAKLGVDRSNLHRYGIKELKQRGLVANHRRVGYYRPDAPPPKHAAVLARKPG
jgi:DNA-binding IclR family transcriptional regulator